MVKKIRIKNSDIPYIEPNVACIGYFDCVHLGHQKLIKETIKKAKELKLVPTLICFDPSPEEVISNEKSKHLLSFKDRLNLFESFGIKQVIIFEFNDSFMHIKPNEFISNYLNKLNINTLICGYDYTFGYKGKGNTSLLVKSKSFNTIVVSEYTYYSKKVSTTRIKEALYEGDFRLVNKLLGWDYYLIVKCEKCTKSANKWLIQAKLKDTRCIMPKDGVYSNNLSIINGKLYLIGNSELVKGQELVLSFNEYK